MQCEECNGRKMERIKRVGFVETFVFSAFGYYPWGCGRCQYKKILKKRGEKKKKSSGNREQTA
jgi:hypothetical protein